MISIDREECKEWRSRQVCGLGGQDHIPPAEAFLVQARYDEGIVIRARIGGSFDWPYYVSVDGVKWRFARHLDDGLAQYVGDER